MARQAWSRKEDLDRRVLEHVRALLLVLALLVERAAALPFVERLRFLAVLSRGEADARRLILALGSDRPPAPPPQVAALFPAAVVAARFRMLALAVAAMLALAGGRQRCRHASWSFGLSGHNPHRAAVQRTPSPAPRATSPPLWAGQSHMEIARMVLARYPHP